jgi:hypothetical protein
MSATKKVVLAYSGGLDTSVILKWLQDVYQCEVVTFTADIGQGEEVEPARKKALALGIKKENIFIEDLREEFVRDFVFPMFRANAVYEGEYLLGTSIARPLIAKNMIEIAKKVGADTISHGATGKGNDQVRFELGAYALMPNVKVIAPWREWDLLSREKLLAYADKHGSRSTSRSARAARPTRWTPTCCTSRTRAASSRTRISQAGRLDVAHHRVAREGTGEAPDHRTRLREGRHRLDRRQAPFAGAPCSRRSTRSAAGTASAASTWSRTATSA